MEAQGTAQTEARAIAAWQRRNLYPVNGANPEWEQCSTREATDHFARSPCHEYRPLYDETALAAKDAELAEVHQQYVDANEARIDAEAQLAERAGGVKDLDWRGSESVWHKADAEFGGYYRITEYSGMQKPFKLETHGWWSGSPSGYYELLDAAKAAAQSDHERRILSDLAEPAGEVEPRACDHSVSRSEGETICVTCGSQITTPPGASAIRGAAIQLLSAIDAGCGREEIISQTGPLRSALAGAKP